MKPLLTLTLTLLSLSLMAEGVPEQAIADQESSQESCAQIRTKDCLTKCKAVKTSINCDTLCPMVSSNECLQAKE